MKKLMTAH